MEDDTIVNPWIEVPKRKRHRTFNQNDLSQVTLSSKSEVEKLQTNSFLNLTLQESRPEDSNSNGIEMTVETTHQPPSPGLTSPPRKRSKKDPTKVCLSILLFANLEIALPSNQDPRRCYQSTSGPDSTFSHLYISDL